MEEARRILTIGGQRDDLAGQPAVLIAVRDFGNGFSPEDNERLFDAFYTTKPERHGHGPAHQPLDRRSARRSLVGDIE